MEILWQKKHFNQMQIATSMFSSAAPAAANILPPTMSWNEAKQVSFLIHAFGVPACIYFTYCETLDLSCCCFF